MANIEQEIRAVLTQMEQGESQDQQPPDTNATTPPGEIQDIYVLIVRETEVEEQAQVVDSTPVLPRKVSFLPAYAICVAYISLILACIVFQTYEILNPPITIVTIIPKSQTVTLTGTLQLGRVLSPLTISQSQTVAATGKGHQDAKTATGYITFYNGQFQSQTITAGTILTGADGRQVITDQDAIIPAGNPPSYGQVTVSAHAKSVGSKGNIQAFDINEACCSTSVLAKNTNSFHGGQDEQSFTTVTQHDIHSVSTMLKTTLTESMSGALQGQAKPNEQLQILPCTIIITSDHQVGEEATQVKVMVSETCSAVVYNSQDLEREATVLLSTQAAKKLGTGYSLLGDAQTSVTKATITPPVVFLSFHAQGTWIYGLSYNAQAQIRHLIAGKSIAEAKSMLQHAPGIQHTSIQLEGLTDRIPKNSNLIHLVVLYEPA